MVFKRCPKCGATTDDTYGFCIKCGYEFPKIEDSKNSCPLCGYQNPDEADFCVKCGTPLLFKSKLESENTVLNPIVVKKEFSESQYSGSKTSIYLIGLGYIFAFLGSIIGLIIGIYLSTRKDPSARRHGHLQIAIVVFYIILVSILIITGIINVNEFYATYRQMFNNTFSSFQR